MKRWRNCFHIISTLSDVALTKNAKVELIKSRAFEGKQIVLIWISLRKLKVPLNNAHSNMLIAMMTAVFSHLVSVPHGIAT